LELSLFLTGNPSSPGVPDPGNPGMTHTFNDILRRQTELAALLNKSAADELEHQPLRMVRIDR
jgi:hypothetical protein